MKNRFRSLMPRSSIVALAALLAAPIVLRAQEPETPAPKASGKPGVASEKATPRPAPTPPGQLVNVRVEVKISDERPGLAPITKVMSVTVADGHSGMVRSTTQSNFGAAGAMHHVPLNVDVSPRLEGNRVRLRVSLDYDFVDPANPKAGSHSVRESLSLVLESGRTVRAAESADPLTDRKVSLDVTATVLK